MANKPIIMSKIKQIIRCHFQGYGSKKTSAITGVSRNTVKQYLQKFTQSGQTFASIEQMSELDLQALFHPSAILPQLPDMDRYKRLQAKIPEIDKALRRKGMTLEKQWTSYIASDPKGYSRSQFYQYIMEYRRRSGITMHIEHKAGEKMFVDFCGDKLQLVDPQTGELSSIEVFVAILGCSQLTYVEACRSQTKEDFIFCCTNAFSYFGGATKAIVPDNLKAAVTKSSKYEPVINEAFASFAEHYSSVVLPARSYRPKDKALVENAVKLIYQRVYTELQDKHYTTLEALNKDILIALEKHNSASLKQGNSRRQIFEEEERQSLTALPLMPFELRKAKSCTVMKNGHVNLQEDKHYYSVPYSYIGKKVKISYSSNLVEIYYHFAIIASHSRDYRRNRYTTQDEHLASKHRFMSEWNPEHFIQKAKQISASVSLFIERLLESKSHPEQAYKACAGVLNLARRVGNERITEACKRAINVGAYHYQVLEEILKRGLDKINEPDEQMPFIGKAPTHQNLRGKDYYEQLNNTIKTTKQ